MPGTYCPPVNDLQCMTAMNDLDPSTAPAQAAPEDAALAVLESRGVGKTFRQGPQEVVVLRHVVDDVLELTRSLVNTKVSMGWI